jgi:hypothetical protein
MVKEGDSVEVVSEQRKTCMNQKRQPGGRNMEEKLIPEKQGRC